MTRIAGYSVNNPGYGEESFDHAVRDALFDALDPVDPLGYEGITTSDTPAYISGTVGGRIAERFETRYGKPPLSGVLATRDDLGISDDDLFILDVGGEGGKYDKSLKLRSGNVHAVNLNDKPLLSPGTFDLQVTPDGEMVTVDGDETYIPNLVQTSGDWDTDPTYPFADHTVDAVMMEGAPVTEHNAREIERVVSRNGFIYLAVSDDDTTRDRIEDIADDHGELIELPDNGSLTEFIIVPKGYKGVSPEEWVDSKGNVGVQGHNFHEFISYARENIEDQNTASPELKASIQAGYKEIKTQQEYYNLLSGDEGLTTSFSSNEKFKDIIRFHQTDADGKIINKGVIDKQASPDAAGLAMYERDFINSIKDGDFNYYALFSLRFKENDSPHHWSDATEQAVDDLLKKTPMPDDDVKEMQQDIINGKWSDTELDAIDQSGVMENNALFHDAVESRDYKAQKQPSEQDYENALEDLSTYLKDGMAESPDKMPELGDEAKGFMQTIVRYYMLNFEAEGDDEALSREAQIYHLADDYLYGDLPDIIGDSVENAFQQDSNDGGIFSKIAHNTVKGDLENRDSQSWDVMRDVITEEYGRYVSWARTTMPEEKYEYPS